MKRAAPALTSGLAACAECGAEFEVPAVAACPFCRSRQVRRVDGGDHGWNPREVVLALFALSWNLPAEELVRAVLGPDLHPNYVAEKVRLLSRGLDAFYAALDSRRASRLVGLALASHGAYARAHWRSASEAERAPCPSADLIDPILSALEAGEFEECPLVRSRLALLRAQARRGAAGSTFDVESE